MLSSDLYSRPFMSSIRKLFRNYKINAQNMLNLISFGNMSFQNTIDSRIVLINKQTPAVSGVSDSRITLFKNGK